MRTNLLVREQRVVCTFPSGRDIVLSRVAGFCSQGRRGETLLINYMAVFTQQGCLTLSSEFLFSQSSISFIYLLFRHHLFPKRIAAVGKYMRLYGEGLFWGGSQEQNF